MWVESLQLQQCLTSCRILFLFFLRSPWFCSLDGSVFTYESQPRDWDLLFMDSLSPTMCSPRFKNTQKLRILIAAFYTLARISVFFLDLLPARCWNIIYYIKEKTKFKDEKMKDNNPLILWILWTKDPLSPPNWIWNIISQWTTHFHGSICCYALCSSQKASSSGSITLVEISLKGKIKLYTNYLDRKVLYLLFSHWI